jgi:predicted DNA-binding transcriptional regulator YafY
MPSKRELAPGPFFRPPLQRMLRIHQAIQSGGYPSADTLARELEVSTKSIYRDLDFMRDRLDLPLAYSAKHRGYCYTGEVHSFPTLQITEGELVALLVAEKALQQYRGTTFEGPLVSAFQKMAAALPDTISLNLEEWGQTISFRTSAEPLLDLGTFDTLAKATVRRQRLLLQYRKPGQRRAEPRTVDPYHLANINGEWFLFGYCHLRQAIRTFVPARIESVAPTGETFARPQSFSLKRLLRDSFGVHSGQGEYQIRVRFAEIVADYIREKKWHPSQQIRELPDGGLELSLKLSSLVEIQRWVLGWGGAAVVLEPAELAAAVREAAARILESPATVGR